MLYSIGRTQKYSNVKSHYIKQNRSIKEQVLNLTEKEKQTFFNYLEHNNQLKIGPIFTITSMTIAPPKFGI